MAARHLSPWYSDFECFMSYDSRFCAFCLWCSFNSSYYHINTFANICYIVSCINYLQTNCINISTDDKDMSKIKVASIFLGHSVCNTHFSWKSLLGMRPANVWSSSPSRYACHQLESFVLITCMTSPFLNMMPSSRHGIKLSSSGS